MEALKTTFSDINKTKNTLTISCFRLQLSKALARNLTFVLVCLKRLKNVSQIFFYY